MKRIVRVFGFAATLLLWSSAARAADVPAFARLVVVKDTKLVKIVIKPLPPDTPPSYPLPPAQVAGEDPTLSDVSDLTVFVYNGAGGSLTDPLTGGQWDTLGRNPLSPKGYLYKNPGAPAGGAVKTALVKPSVIKIVAKDDGSLLPGPIGAADVGVSLVVGSTSYCAGSDGGIEKQNDVAKWKYKETPVPLVCPSPPPCCAGAAFHSFRVADAPGDCGDLPCSGLYAGGPMTVAALPATPPDLGQAISAITSCVAQTATLGPTASAETGSNRNCTAAGCLFGAPLAIPTPVAPVVSTCIITRVAGTSAGTLDCATGAQSLSLALDAIVYLTGDFVVDPLDTIPGAQPCPLCEGGTCIGGPNNGMACFAGTSDLGDGYPTSHDCPPDPMFDVGTLPLSLALSTGTVSWTGTTASNDDGTGGNQSQVFSGFCRDADDTGTFANPAEPCWENGMAVGAPCAGVFETCEQRTGGAFGPVGGNLATLTLIGTPQAGIMSGSAPGTLVTFFSIQPSFNVTVDAAYDLPGPGAVALPGTGDLCTDAMACP